MQKRLLRSPGIVLPILLSFACATVGVYDDPDPLGWPEREIVAREMPVVAIETRERVYVPVKIIRLQGEELTILPHPYWNVGLQKIDCGTILTIRLLEKPSQLARFGVSGFLGGFGITGLIGAAFSRYNTEYRSGLTGALILGSLAGLVGAILGAVADASSPRKWRLAGMEPRQRLDVLMRIMGVRR